MVLLLDLFLEGAEEKLFMSMRCQARIFCCPERSLRPCSVLKVLNLTEFTVSMRLEVIHNYDLF